MQQVEGQNSKLDFVFKTYLLDFGGCIPEVGSNPSKSEREGGNGFAPLLFLLSWLHFHKARTLWFYGSAKITPIFEFEFPLNYPRRFGRSVFRFFDIEFVFVV